MHVGYSLFVRICVRTAKRHPHFDQWNKNPCVLDAGIEVIAVSKEAWEMPGDWYSSLPIGSCLK